MRYIFILLFAGFGINLLAQKPFEGKISYVIGSPRDKQDARLFAYFGKNKIRIEVSDKNDLRSQVYTIVNLDSGKVFTVSSANKMFTTKLLQKNKPIRFDSLGEIAGFKATTIPPQQMGKDFRLGGALAYATIYLANDLFFPDSDKYFGSEFLFIVQNGRYCSWSKSSFIRCFCRQRRGHI